MYYSRRLSSSQGEAFLVQEMSVLLLLVSSGSGHGLQAWGPRAFQGSKKGNNRLDNL